MTNQRKIFFILLPAMILLPILILASVIHSIIISNAPDPDKMLFSEMEIYTEFDDWDGYYKLKIHDNYFLDFSDKESFADLHYVECPDTVMGKYVDIVSYDCPRASASATYVSCYMLGNDKVIAIEYKNGINGDIVLKLQHPVKVWHLSAHDPEIRKFDTVEEMLDAYHVSTDDLAQIYGSVNIDGKLTKGA